MQSDFGALQVVSNALQAADLRQQVYANNVANLQTPGYKRQDVQFESILQDALTASTASSGSVDSQVSASGVAPYNWATGVQVQPTVITDNSTKIDNNGNNVDVDAEMSDIAENQVKYQALAEDLKTRFSRLQTAISGG